MTTSLTEPMSKKLLLSLLIVVFGAEAVLYLSRFSSLASSLYDAIMVASLFIGWRISPRLDDVHTKQKTKRQMWIKFTGAFLIFYIGSTAINIYSSFTFQDFSADYDQYVEDSTNSAVYSGHETGTDPVYTFFDKVDTVGLDLYTDSLAGLEEVWRLSYLIIILLVCKKIFRRRWEKGSRDFFLLLALFITSIFFGIDHTLDTEQPWSVKVGAIVTFANMGFVLGMILLWTRNLWITVIVHSLYDITATLSWYYFEYTLEAVALIVAMFHVIFLTLEKRKFKQQQMVEAAQVQIMD